MPATESADGNAMPWRTIEVRWFLPGSVPDGMREAFLELWPGARQEPHRVDRYVRLDTDALSVKQRGDLLEAKGCLADLGLVTVGALVGRWQHWAKWSVPSPAHLVRPDIVRETDLAVGTAWLEVSKLRLLSPVQREAGPSGAAVELCQVRCAGHVAWSVAVEAPGSGEEPRAAVRNALDRLATGAPSRALRAETSLAYPAWLRRIAAGSPPGGN